MVNNNGGIFILTTTNYFGVVSSFSRVVNSNIYFSISSNPKNVEKQHSRRYQIGEGVTNKI